MNAPAVREETVELWSGRLPLTVSVAGSGPPLLYLHQAAGLVWDPFLTHLAQRYTVYAPQFPGTTLGEPYAVHVIDHLPDLVLAYEELVRGLGLDRPVVVGQSFGGMLGAELAATFPDLTDKLVLLAPLGLWREEAPTANLLAASAEKLPGLLFHNAEVAAAAMAMPEDPESAVTAASQMVWSMGCAGKFIWPIPDRGLRARLHRVTAGTLIVWGRQDAFVPARYADDFADLIAHSKVAMIEKSGHLPQVEQFEQTAAAVDEFLS
jgi:pimeloyl-ACP methyl ester carboxylesterase